MALKLAASIDVWVSAKRQSTELAAKASMAALVSQNVCTAEKGEAAMVKPICRNEQCNSMASLGQKRLNPQDNQQPNRANLLHWAIK